MWEMFVYILGVDEWPGTVVAMTDGCEPGVLCWVPCCCMEVADCLFDAWQFIYIEDGVFITLE